MTTLDRTKFGALLFEEEFAGSALDPTKWINGSYGWGWIAGTATAPAHATKTSHVLSDGSVCSMEAANTTVAAGMAQMVAKKGGSNWQMPWSAPLIRTAPHFKPGCYIEGRMKFPSGQGFWPAFWLCGPAPSAEADVAKQFTGEIDIVEGLMASPSVQHITVHWDKEQHYAEHSVQRLNMATQFIVFGCAWTASGFQFYQDDVLVASIPWQAAMAASLDQEMQILLNLSVGGNWGGPPAPELTEGLMQVDWVRVHALAGS